MNKGSGDKGTVLCPFVSFFVTGGQVWDYLTGY